MKYSILATLIIIIALTVLYTNKDTPQDLGAKPLTEAAIVTGEAIEQAAYKTTNTRYKQKLRQPLSASFEIEMHEYLGPKGAGYQAYIYKQDATGNRLVKSFGEGPEATSRSFDWRPLTSTTATTTP